MAKKVTNEKTECTAEDSLNNSSNNELAKQLQEKEQELLKKEEELKDMINTSQRLQAEFDNYRKRIDKEYESMKSFACEDLIMELLDVLDNFERAMMSKEHKEFTKGIELIYAQFYELMEQQGLKKISTDGKFDPYKHEVLLTEKSDKESGTILEELQSGYLLGDKIIRHAKVKIAKKEG
jgi:molecular chaperone GrpE